MISCFIFYERVPLTLFEYHDLQGVELCQDVSDSYNNNTVITIYLIIMISFLVP